MATGADGNIYIMGTKLQRMDGKTGKLDPIDFTADMHLDRAAEREFLLQFVRHEVGERFYEKNMHGVKWNQLIDHYTQFLPHIANNYDFAEMLSEILGELNVSHTGGRYRRPAASDDDATAQLGLFFDRTYTGEGMRVTEVIAGGPFDRKSSKVRRGDVVTAINGITLTKDTDIAQLLNGQARKKVLVSFKNGHEETVIPITSGALSGLLYKRWVKRCEHIVDSVSGGRLGYVHIESMDDASFRTAYSAMLGKYNLRDGCVIDTRWNGGGRLHEDIEILTSGKKYLTQVVRGVESCDMPSRRYIKPTIMVQGEANYSNAHDTPWVYKQMGIGRLVGAPVPGTMTSVNWVTTQDPSLVFGIPVVGYLLEDGKTYLENLQLEPDIYVLNKPEDIIRGIDQQLITATKELLKEIDSKK
jgi:C-terminal processing protease CtpA/Prc